jgi:predicted membrane protein
MKTTKRAFDLIFIIISALILITFSEYGFLEGHMGFLLIPVLIAYYLGQYSERKFTQNGTVKRFR